MLFFAGSHERWYVQAFMPAAVAVVSATFGRRLGGANWVAAVAFTVGGLQLGRGSTR
jgi:hypothetical protein